MTDMEGIANDELFLNKLNSLQSDAKTEDGWTEMLNEGKFKIVTKDLRPDETLMRGTFEIDLPPKQCFTCFTYTGNERKDWDSACKSSELLKELGPGDIVIMWGIKVNRAIKYMMKLPDKMCMRMVTRENWPEQGSYGYALLPYDEEKGVTLEEFGPMKMKCGTIKPHPDDPNKSILETLESNNLKYVPMFVLKGMMKKLGPKKIQEFVDKYQKSTVYKQNE